MTNQKGPSVEPGPRGNGGYVERAEGAKRKVSDVPYVELLDHSKKLGRLGNWEVNKAFTTAGVLFLGAGIGASVSGAKIGDTGVLLCLAVGAVLLLASLFIRGQRIESVKYLKADWDQVLSYYEHDEELRKMREQYGKDPTELPPGAPLGQRAKRFLRL